jgi:hypothetical protein
MSIPESDLFNICFQSNHISGHIKSYKWVTIAIGQYDSIISIDTFQIHIKLKKTLQAFDLILPIQNSTEIVEKGQNNKLNFIWNSSLGATSYKWVLTDILDPNFNQNILVQLSSDTNILIKEDSIHKKLIDLGYSLNQNKKFFWRVTAFDTYDSLIAQSDFSIILNLKDPSVGVQNLSLIDKIKVYPSPFKENFTIINSSSEVMTNIQLLNINGQIIKTISSISTNQSTQINALYIPEGIYFIKFIWNNSIQWIQVIKQ